MQEEALLKILVFKTNIHQDCDIVKAAEIFNDHPNVKRWTIDRHDVDNVLRIETDQLESAYIIDVVKNAGFACEELPD